MVWGLDHGSDTCAKGSVCQCLCRILNLFSNPTDSHDKATAVASFFLPPLPPEFSPLHPHIYRGYTTNSTKPLPSECKGVSVCVNSSHDNERGGRVCPRAVCLLPPTTRHRSADPETAGAGGRARCWQRTQSHRVARSARECVIHPVRVSVAVPSTSQCRSAVSRGTAAALMTVRKRQTSSDQGMIPV